MIAYMITEDQILIRRYTILHIIPMPRRLNRATKLHRLLNKARIIQGRTYVAPLATRGTATRD